MVSSDVLSSSGLTSEGVTSEVVTSDMVASKVVFPQAARVALDALGESVDLPADLNLPH